MQQWEWRTFEELNNQELYDILSLRQEVFVIEQHCFYSDLDYQDQQAMHLLGINEGKLTAYLRLLPAHTPYPDAVSFGRVLTAPFARGRGLGKDLITQVLLYLDKRQNTLPIMISAQLYLERFYQSFGFETISGPYDEAGIPHIKMKKT